MAVLIVMTYLSLCLFCFALQQQKLFTYENECQVSNIITSHVSLMASLSLEVGGKGRGGLVGKIFLRYANSLLLKYVAKH